MSSFTAVAIPPEPLAVASVLGLPVHLAADYGRWLGACLKAGQGAHVVTLNAEMTMQAAQDPQLAAIIRRADLVVPDGAGVVFHLRLRGQRIQRTPGIELAANFLRQVGHWQRETPARRDGHSAYPIVFYGGKPGTAAAAAAYWERRVPGLTIALTQHGYLTAAEQAAFHQQLADLQPRVILVGLGVPRQEVWIAQQRSLCPDAIWIGVGGSFDIWAGVKARAPLWFRRYHLEWLYRLYQEPWRWRRMLALPQFALQSLGDYLATAVAAIVGG
ncbi:WecB/TagA/CpsF family glycosyltransferase [Trichothermofontia sichuanensis B231]|uniref:WecB/TagA/CpsF family glycosyltransferase n=1 Tax=Trichothermofontia sichuanensis TaxID=3045816 RepID=UPI002245B896|nr:WecB/TagA/CpsF family glycosyltransferase [Trichothermofontia sichuanensis]UZQ54703.1 WecB/TagA/CpsF family glycosyltransferase [Trichothermofontia sichuanensis B231]